MSLRIMDAVRQRSNAKGSARLVLMFLAWYANDEGIAWPSQGTLARDAALDIRNVRRALALLVAMGEIVIVGRARRSVVTYRIIPGAGEHRADAPYVDPSEPRAEAPYVDASTPGGGVLGRRRPRAEAPCPPRAEAPSHLGRRRPTNSKEPSLEPSCSSTTGEQAFLCAVEEWNKLATELGLLPVNRLTASRRSLLAAILAECGGLDGWRAALDKIRATPFLRGENDRGWRVSFDWLIDETNFAKILENNYESYQPANGDGRDDAGHSPRRRSRDGYDAALAGLYQAIDRRKRAHE